MYNEIIEYIRCIYSKQNPVLLHPPVFLGNEKKYLADCIDKTFVSYIGEYVTRFEDMTAKYTGAQYSVAVVNGTTALHIALLVAGVNYGDEVITQSLTFVATANAITHCGAKPVFIDVDIDTLGMSPEKLNSWLEENTYLDTLTNKTINKSTKKNISAILPMHTFGHPCRIDKIVDIANKYKIPVIEDSAESLGSFYKKKHTGTFGLAGVISYNGNKTITTGGGGMIITNTEDYARKVKHITTTAKLPHKWEFVHDMVAYNYRLTNVNAAIGVAQMENIQEILKNKRETALLYQEYFTNTEIEFIKEPENSVSNYWLNAIKFNEYSERNAFLEKSNSSGVMTRPIWCLLNKLDMYKDCQTDGLVNSIALEQRIVNLPSGFRQ